MSKESVVRNNMWKWLVLLLVSIGSVYLAYPPREKVRLGLDLAGGSSFTLGVDYARLQDKILEREPEKYKNNPEGLEIEAKGLVEDSDDRIIEIIRRRVDAMGTNEPVIQPVGDKHQIVVQLPGIDDAGSEKAKERLKKMAYLEFRFVPDNENELISKIPDGACPPGYVASGDNYIRAKDYEEVSSQSNYLARVASFGTTDRRVKFVLQPVKTKNGGAVEYYRPRYVERKIQLTGDALESATANSAQGLRGGYEVDFKLRNKAAAKFSTLTKNNVGRNLAIILDDQLVSAPEIKSEIGRSGQITGDFTLEEAKELAADLNAGALPVPLKIESSSQVSPTVGKDAINAGRQAALIGFILVALFMLFYYWYAGLVANVALLLDVFLLPAALFLVAHILGIFVEDPSMAGAKVQLPVLTMPGIAGLVLTLGMAVDANVLIFERIREEFQRGAAVGKAVANGYGRAFTAILDSNITTIITGCILYSVGTGPVRGFAIMLTGGVVISMFTAVVVTRLVIDHTTNPDSSKPFKMRQFFKAPSIDFMKMGRTTVIASSAIIAISLAIFAFRLVTNPGSVLAVDLTGGTAVTYTIEGEAEAIDKGSFQKEFVGAVRHALAPIDNAMVVQCQEDGRKLFLKTGVTSDPGTTVTLAVESGADKFNHDATKRALASAQYDATVLFEEGPAAEAGAKTATVTVKVAETTGSKKGQELAAAGRKVVDDIAEIVASRNKNLKISVKDSKEVLGVEYGIAKALAEEPKLKGLKFTEPTSETIGSMVGKDLRESGTKAVLFSLVAILLYVAFRFRFGFGLGGIAALAHDALISLGLFSLCGRQVSLIVVTALLTIVGYSINDTVVVFDRIREQLKRDPRTSFVELCNQALNACLSRTVITSLTTFFAVAALFIFGDGSIYDFALTMLIGVVAGTYSSMFIATPVMYWWYRGKRPDLDDEEDKKETK